MITLTVSLQVLPGHLDAFVEAIRTNAERSFTDEPGCHHFDVCQDVADDHHFVLYEVYTDQAAVEAHRAAPHFATWRSAVAEHVVPGSQRNVLADRRFHHAR
ncbi:putative quinol monooxygenase [Kribbella endophytica]